MMRSSAVLNAAALTATVLFTVGCATQPTQEPSAIVNPVVDYDLYTHCGLDHINFENNWYTLTASAGLKGLSNPPKGWDLSQSGQIRVLGADEPVQVTTIDGAEERVTAVDDGEKLIFSTPEPRTQLVYQRNNPQPPRGEWVCA